MRRGCCAVVATNITDWVSRSPSASPAVAAIAQPLVGHVLGLQAGADQPSKLAAFELAQSTEGPAPLRIGGILIDGHTRFAITIPKIGSIIAKNSFTEPVRGLNSIPPQDRPPVNLTHLSFQGMVGIGTLLALVVTVYWLGRWRGHEPRDNVWFLRFAVAAGPLAILATELGWIATEVGRQPWVVYGIERTTAAASRNGGLWWSYGTVLVLYLGMSVAAFKVLRSMARRWRAGETDLPSPYGPGAADVEEAVAIEAGRVGA